MDNFGNPRPKSTRQFRLAGRLRKGIPVSGKWTLTTIQTILRNPLYMGEIAWGRRGAGSTFRFDPTTEQGYREATIDEVDPETSKGIVVFSHDQSQWNIATPAKAFEPIVPREMWLSNFKKLNDVGKKRGTRGIPKAKNPNKYPLQVVCGDCGQ